LSSEIYDAERYGKAQKASRGQFYIAMAGTEGLLGTEICVPSQSMSSIHPVTYRVILTSPRGRISLKWATRREILHYLQNGNGRFRMDCQVILTESCLPYGLVLYFRHRCGMACFDDLGHDRQRDLLWCICIDFQSNRRVDAVDLVLGKARFTQSLDA
jgi:hypothetical protein